MKSNKASVKTLVLWLILTAILGCWAVKVEQECIDTVPGCFGDEIRTMAGG